MQIKFPERAIVLSITDLAASLQNAHQWHKNGDHPLDYVGDTEGFEGGELVTFSGEHRRAHAWEGSLVRYYRHPEVPGTQTCAHCGLTMHVHGWIDQRDDQVVCPEDWVIMLGAQHYPLKPELFEALTGQTRRHQPVAIEPQEVPQDREPDDSITPNA